MRINNAYSNFANTRQLSSESSLDPLDKLLKTIARLPGLGPRSARRIVLHLLSERDSQLESLVEQLEHAKQNILSCSQCANLSTQDPCHICQ
ncbi:MAG: hypothetical protein AAF403_04710, partial [Pseudomonadota bacterium]